MCACVRAGLKKNGCRGREAQCWQAVFLHAVHTLALKIWLRTPLQPSHGHHGYDGAACSSTGTPSPSTMPVTISSNAVSFCRGPSAPPSLPCSFSFMA